MIRNTAYGIVLCVGALGLVGCASTTSEEEARARAEPRIEAARREGVAFREALPWCEPKDVPEGAQRIEGVLHQSRGCTRLLCIPEVCCNECSGPVYVRSDDGQQMALVLPGEGPLNEHFHGERGIDCEHHAWWEGFGRPRVRMTWSTTEPEHKAEFIELCRIRP
ncbi:hypothetical protein [Polyangium sp. 15x6]|uniref:hypothetical protein n=1 Tax=Polyangium sp. 15x6 TaxID=3042687 RepID=UPI00249BFD05|nr:hypothetical protein [Polyangium sp. 15x6]MDI3282172.1 hypothetical protein [Polyangium sp. 15x6]